MRKTAFFQSKNRYFPQISRIFTARPFFWIFLGVTLGILASISLWYHPKPRRTAVPTNRNIASDQGETSKNQAYEEWKQIVEKRPDYRDGFMMLAWYARELGKSDEEKAYIQKALSLDPGYSVPEVFQVEKQ